MPKVLCTLENASEEISGVKFAAHERGMISEEISEEAAARFASIDGYELIEEDEATPPAPAPAPAAKAPAAAKTAKKAAPAPAPVEPPAADAPAAYATAADAPPAGKVEDPDAVF